VPVISIDPIPQTQHTHTPVPVGQRQVLDTGRARLAFLLLARVERVGLQEIEQVGRRLFLKLGRSPVEEQTASPCHGQLS